MEEGTRPHPREDDDVHVAVKKGKFVAVDKRDAAVPALKIPVASWVSL